MADPFLHRIVKYFLKGKLKDYLIFLFNQSPYMKVKQFPLCILYPSWKEGGSTKIVLCAKFWQGVIGHFGKKV